jgi:hypothetical protein
MARPCGGTNSNICVAEGCYAESCIEEETVMTQPDSDRVYMSLTFGNISRKAAEDIRQAAEDLAGDVDFSVDFGAPIGNDDPTPVADETAAALSDTPAPVITDEPDSAS